MAFKGFTYAELDATLVQPGDTLCAALDKVMAAQRLAYKYERYKRDDAGAISDAYCGEIKACVTVAAVPTT